MPIREHSHLQRGHSWERADVLGAYNTTSIIHAESASLGWVELKSFTFHLPAHFVSQNPEEIGANEVGYTGREEGHP